MLSMVNSLRTYWTNHPFLLSIGAALVVATLVVPEWLVTAFVLVLVLLGYRDDPVAYMPLR